jgi:hypothetical protein
MCFFVFGELATCESTTSGCLELITHEKNTFLLGGTSEELNTFATQLIPSDDYNF